MDGQRPSGSGRRHRKRSRPEESRGKTSRREAPILIAARRPDAPAARPKRKFIAASAAPVGGPSSRSQAFIVDLEETAASADAVEEPSDERVEKVAAAPEASPRRAARIVQVNASGTDNREAERLRLVARLLASEGRAAISRAANELSAQGYEFPVAQDVQLQLLEHFDESCAFQAIGHLSDLIKAESPIKRPLFEQRLRRLEEVAEDSATRAAAAELRRAVRG